MDLYTLVVIDTTGIQSYIFGSNRLRENVGASHLVYQATEGWLLDNPNELLGTVSHNIDRRAMVVEKKIEQGLDAELLYAGGGNALLLFKDAPSARKFTHNLSCKLLQEAPGLDAVVVHQEVDWHNGSICQAIDSAFDGLKHKKLEREWSQPMMGLGVTAQCQSTSTSASWYVAYPGERSRYETVSSEVYAKWKNNNPAKDRLRDISPDRSKVQLIFPDDFDQLGRTEGDFSYIAVVHADGNSMGKTIKGILKRLSNHTGSQQNRDCIEELRKFSKSVRQAGKESLKSTIAKASDWNQRRLAGGNQSEENKYLSIRPIVFGGDDVTFVCDGRIGLQLAETYLNAFNAQKIPDAKGECQSGIAAAGVAIVKVRYPFARAYELSEALCKNAKETFDRKLPALDWHIAQSGLFGDLRYIRQQEYQERRNDVGKITRSLLQRPLATSDDKSSNPHHWSNFTELLKTFQNREQWSRTKVMRLREALTSGSDAVAAYVTNYGELPKATGDLSPQHVKKGWDGGRCVYFDAIEMIEQDIWEGEKRDDEQ